jgi:hypothetical protein
MSFRNHKDFADAQGRIRDLSLVISRRPCRSFASFRRSPFGATLQAPTKPVDTYKVPTRVTASDDSTTND